MKRRKQALVYLTAAMLLLGGCGSSAGSAEKYENTMVMEEAAADAGGGFYEVGDAAADGASETDGVPEAAQARKLIRDVDMSVETAETVEDIIAINQQLTDVRYQLESMESQLRTYDNQIDYSTVWLSVSETAYYEPYEEKGAWERISSGFSENVHRVGRFFKNFGIEFVIALPIIVPVALVIAAAVLLFRWMLIRSGKKQEKRRESMRAQRKNVSGQTAPEAAGTQSLNERYRGSGDIPKEKEQEGKEKDT